MGNQHDVEEVGHGKESQESYRGLLSISWKVLSTSINSIPSAMEFQHSPPSSQTPPTPRSLTNTPSSRRSLEGRHESPRSVGSRSQGGSAEPPLDLGA